MPDVLTHNRAEERSQIPNWKSDGEQNGKVGGEKDCKNCNG
jgi:hypothetical protein